MVNEHLKDNREVGVITLKESIDLPIFTVGGIDKGCHRNLDLPWNKMHSHPKFKNGIFLDIHNNFLLVHKNADVFVFNCEMITFNHFINFI